MFSKILQFNLHKNNKIYEIKIFGQKIYLYFIFIVLNFNLFKLFKKFIYFILFLNCF